MPKKSFELASYQNSPLAKFLSALLEVINTIKASYPDDKTSAEHHRAFILVQWIENGLMLQHQKILPLFNKGKIPGSMTLSTLSVSFLNFFRTSSLPLLRELYTREHIFYLNVIQFFVEKDHYNQPFEPTNRALTHSKENFFKNNPVEIFFQENSLLATFFPMDLDFVFTDQEKEELFQGVEKKLFSLQHVEANIADKIATQLILSRINHPIFYCLIEKTQALFDDLPKDFRLLVPFLNPSFFPEFNLKTVITKNINIQAVTILSEKDYQYEITFKKRPEDASVRKQRVDLSEEYQNILTSISISLSIWRREILAIVDPNNPSLQPWIKTFTQRERSEVEKNNQLKAQFDKQSRERESVWQTVYQTLLQQVDDRLSLVDYSHAFLNKLTVLDQYIRQDNKTPGERLPKLILVGDLQNYRVEDTDAMQPDMQKANRFLSIIITSLNKRSDILRLQLPSKFQSYDSNDTLDEIKSKKNQNHEVLTELENVATICSSQIDAISVHLQEPYPYGEVAQKRAKAYGDALAEHRLFYQNLKVEINQAQEKLISMENACHSNALRLQLDSETIHQRLGEINSQIQQITSNASPKQNQPILGELKSNQVSKITAEFKRIRKVFSLRLRNHKVVC